MSSALVGDGTSSKSFALPSFSILANPGWALSGPVTGFLGNLAFTALNGGTTSVSYAGRVGFEVATVWVPEPGSYALLLAGLGAIGLVARRRRG